NTAGCNFSKAVTYTGGRHNSPRTPQTGQSNLKGAHHRLYILRLTQTRVRFISTELFENRPIGPATKYLVAFLYGCQKRRFFRQQLPAHCPPLRTLPREHKSYPALASLLSRSHSTQNLAMGKSFQFLTRFLLRPGNQRQPVFMMSALCAGSVSNVPEGNRRL